MSKVFFIAEEPKPDSIIEANSEWLVIDSCEEPIESPADLWFGNVAGFIHG